MHADKRSGRAIVLHIKDNTATALENLNKDSEFYVDDVNTVVLQNHVRFGHKFALIFIAKGEPVYKYGVSIGTAISDIHRGEHIHLHNLQSAMITSIQSTDQSLEGSKDEGIQASGWKNRNT